MAQRYDYEMMFARRESKVTVINKDGSSETISHKEFKQRNAPKKAKKRSTIVDSNSVTSVADVIAKLEKACKWLNSLKAYKDNGYRQWGVIARNIIEMDGVREYLGKACAHYSGYCRPYMHQVKAMSRHNDSDLFQYVNWIYNHFVEIRNNLSSLMSAFSQSGVLYAFRNEECIKGSADGKRVGLRQLVQNSTDGMSKIDNIINELRTIIDNGVNPNEYAINGKRVG